MNKQMASFVSHLISGAAGGMLVLLALMPHMAKGADSTVFEKIKARSFTLVNAKGQEAGDFSCFGEENLPRLTLRHSDLMGWLRVTGDANNGYRAGLGVQNSNIKNPSMINAEISDGAAELMISGSSMSNGIIASSNGNKQEFRLIGTHPALSLMETTGSASSILLGYSSLEDPRAGLKVTRPTGSIIIFDKTGRTLWAMPPQ